MLPTLVSGPSRILSEGTHRGFPWVVVHNDMGYRCGYIKVPIGHPWETNYPHEVEVHGGVTYKEFDTNQDGLWIGFDCAHAGDAPDPILPNKDSVKLFQFPGDTIKDTSYVRHECRQLCEQAYLAQFKETSYKES